MEPVAFDVPVEVAFDYLVEPRHRPEWQSSLRRIEQVDGQVRVGQTWTDVTVPGFRPSMRTTVLDRPRAWTEVGTWRGLHAELSLTFVERPEGCAIAGVWLTIRARGLARLPAKALARVAPYAIRSDLKRAARILSERSAEH